MKVTNIISTVLVIMGLLVAPALIIAEDCSAATFGCGISKSSSENINPLVKGSSRGGSFSSSSKYVKKVDWDDDEGDDGESSGSIPFWAIILILIVILLIIGAIVYFAYIKK